MMYNNISVILEEFACANFFFCFRIIDKSGKMLELRNKLSLHYNRQVSTFEGWITCMHTVRPNQRATSITRSDWDRLHPVYTRVRISIDSYASRHYLGNEPSLPSHRGHWRSRHWHPWKLRPRGRNTSSQVRCGFQIPPRKRNSGRV
jgi:hypothetical protein